jgi:DNA invertase Pin-like site-specific DNA recombinase
MRAAVYIRFSTDKQEDSPERQRATTTPVIKSGKFTFYKEYRDEARRGWDDARPGFRQLLADAQARMFDVIVVDECSRLSRVEPVEFFGEVVWPLKRAGVQLYSVAEGGIQDWNNLPGVMLTAVYQDRSSGESRKTAWRVTSNYLKLASEGRIDLGKPPYGYKRIRLPDGRPTYVPDPDHPEHVEVVRFIFDAYANRDMSLRDIGRELEKRGVLTPAGKKVWSQNCVGRILREMKYAGCYVFNRVRQGRFYRLGAEGVEKAEGMPTETGMNPRDAWRVRPDSHEPLVPVELFTEVQTLLAANRRRTTPAPNRGEFMLAKLLVCGSCGSPMAGHRNGRGKPPFYRCTRAMSTAQHHCHNNLVKESEVLDGILAALEGKLLNPAFLELCREEARRVEEEAAGAGRLEALRAEGAALEREIGRARGRLLKVDDETFDFLNGEISRLTARRKDVEAELGGATLSCRGRMDELIARLEREIRGLRESVQGRDPQRVRAAVRRLVARVELRVERRLVGRVKHRYFLVGGDVFLRGGTGLGPGGQTPPEAPARVLSTRGVKKVRASLPGVDPTDNLSPVGPTPCPR